MPCFFLMQKMRQKSMKKEIVLRNCYLGNRLKEESRLLNEASLIY